MIQRLKSNELCYLSLHLYFPVYFDVRNIVWEIQNLLNGGGTLERAAESDQDLNVDTNQAT